MPPRSTRADDRESAFDESVRERWEGGGSYVATACSRGGEALADGPEALFVGLVAEFACALSAVGEDLPVTPSTSGLLASQTAVSAPSAGVAACYAC